jgi:hypothetical protein
MDLTDFYRVLYLTAAEYRFFSAAHGISSIIDLILEHKASHKK